MKSARKGGRGRAISKVGMPQVLRTGGTDQIWVSEKILLLSDSVTFLVDLSSTFSAKVLFPEHSQMPMEFQLPVG